MDQHIATYGSVAILRGRCPSCQTYALIIDGRYACCNNRTEELHVTRTKSMSPAPEFRKPIPRAEKERILSEQDHRCLYCLKQFGTKVVYHARERVIRIHWDHKVPFSYGHDNRVSNIAAACQFCNQWKTNTMFRSIEEIQVYVQDRWSKEATTRRARMFILSQEIQTSPQD